VTRDDGHGRLAGKIAIVTGAGGGIGTALARGAAREGAAVACVDIDGERAECTAEMLRREGRRVLSVETDLTDFGAVADMVDEVEGALGAVTTVFSNAGGGCVPTPFLELSEEDWRVGIDVNLTSAFYVGLHTARKMAANRGGAIVYTSSQLAQVARQGLTHYGSAKGGVTQLVRQMALELAEHGIRVNAVAPGPIGHERNNFMSSAESVRLHELMIPMRRIGTPEEVVGAAIYLASDEASYTTGTTLTVDGGYTSV
jgi:NAD(P)-dependent dehydrogenase (short-subunit alcohol dehydrogenase family)